MTGEGVLPSRLRIFLLCLGGAMLGLAFPPLPTGVLAGFGLVPLLIVLKETKSLGGMLRASYVTFFIMGLFSLWWVGGFVHGKDPYLMVAGVSLILGHPLFMFVAVIGFALIRRALGFRTAVLALPFLWVSFEYLHSITQFAFPWLVLGNTQTYNLEAIQIAEFTGVYGLSWWLVWINVVAYFLYEKVAEKQWSPTSRNSIVVVFSIVLIYFVPRLYGALELRNVGVLEDGRPVKVGIIQPDIDPFEKWQENADRQLHVLKTLTASLGSDSVDLIVWPETATPFFILSPQYQDVLQEIRSMVDSLGSSLFTGIPDIIYYTDPASAPKSSRLKEHTDLRYDLFNSSMLLEPGTRNIQKYAKIILVPFAERVPYAELLAFSPSLQWNFGLGGWGIGTETTVFKMRLRNSATVRFSSLICYESIYPGFVAGFVRQGAEFLTIITNDSWWGNTFGAYQHQRFAIFRAIENRRWIVRCANGGISCFIDPLGNVVQPTSMYRSAAFSGEIKARTKNTFFTRHGDLFALANLYFTIVLITAAMGRAFYNNYRRRSHERD
jgi:apolipoprotein N-acyltransferase